MKERILRILARVIDLGAWYLLGLTTAYFLPLALPPIGYGILLIAALLTAISSEFFFLRLFRRTPGMALTGLKLESAEEGNLSFWDGVKGFFGLSHKVSLERRPSKRFAKVVAISLLILSGSGLMYEKALPMIAPEIFISGDVEGWFSFADKIHGYSVKMPLKPEEMVQRFDLKRANKEVEFKEYQAKRLDEVNYNVAAIDVPLGKWKMFGARMLLPKLYEVFLEGKPKAKSLNDEVIRQGKHTALDFTYIEEGERVHGRMILIDEKLYVLRIGQPTGQSEEMLKVQAEDFFNSFKV